MCKVQSVRQVTAVSDGFGLYFVQSEFRGGTYFAAVFQSHFGSSPLVFCISTDGINVSRVSILANLALLPLIVVTGLQTLLGSQLRPYMYERTRCCYVHVAVSNLRMDDTWPSAQKRGKEGLLHLSSFITRVATGARHRDVFIHGRYHEAARRGCFGLKDSETLPPAHCFCCLSEQRKTENASCVK